MTTEKSTHDQRVQRLVYAYLCEVPVPTENIPDFMFPYLDTKVASRHKNAGEVRFIKDDGVRAPERRIPAEDSEDFTYQSKQLKPLAQVLWSLTCSMGHLLSGHGKFNRIKSRSISPDGQLGGKGYIQQISQMRKDLAECVEKLSSITDTLFDELQAPHWNPRERLTEEELEEFDEILEDSRKINEDPEAFDEDQYQKEVLDDI